MGILDSVGGFFKKAGERIYTNVRDNWYYAGRLRQATPWWTWPLIGSMYVMGVTAGVLLSPLPTGGASVISILGCTINSAKSYEVSHCCTEACRRMNQWECKDYQQSRCIGNTTPTVSNPVFNPQQPPPQPEAPAAQEGSAEAEQSESEPPQEDSNDRCGVFDAIEIDYGTFGLDNCDTTLFINFYFDEEVPGMESGGQNDGYDYFYRVEIGRSSTSVLSDECRTEGAVIGRLLCSVEIPASFEDTLQPMELTVNRCEDSSGHLQPIYSNTSVSIPPIKGCATETPLPVPTDEPESEPDEPESEPDETPVDSTACSENLSQDACTAAGFFWDDAYFKCDCP